MNDICAICLDTKKPLNFTTLCNHKFHKECIKKWINQSGTCPYCRTYLKTIFNASINKYIPIFIHIKINEKNLSFKYPNNIYYNISFSKIKYIYYDENKIKFEILKDDGDFKIKTIYIKPKNHVELFFTTLKNKLDFLSLQ